MNCQVDKYSAAYAQFVRRLAGAVRMEMKIEMEVEIEMEMALTEQALVRLSADNINTANMAPNIAPQVTTEFQRTYERNSASHSSLATNHSPMTRRK